MVYLLVVAINIANLKPVVLKDCIQFKSVDDANVEDIVKEIEKVSYCEKSPDAKTWNCMNKNAGIVTKIALLKDKKECKSFPKEMATKLKTLMGR